MLNINNLVCDEDCFDKNSDIIEWLKILSDEWMKSGYMIAGMDIDSDSYCVFITGSGYPKIDYKSSFISI